MPAGSGWLTIGNDKESRDSLINAYYRGLYNASEKLPNDATYSFSLPDYQPSLGFEAFAEVSEGYKSVIRSYFNYINRLLGTTFRETGQRGNISFAALVDADGDAAAAGYANNTGFSRVSATQYVEQDPEVGSYSNMALIHELGHSLGLSHPYPYADGGGIPTKSDADVPEEYDSSLLSIMSYFKAQLATSFSQGNPGKDVNRTFYYRDRRENWSYVTSFSPLDWKALEEMYGSGNRLPERMVYQVVNSGVFHYDVQANIATISAGNGFSITNHTDDIVLDASRLTRPGWNRLDIRADAGIDFADGYRLDTNLRSQNASVNRSLQDSWDSDNFWSIYLDADVKVAEIIGSSMNDSIEGDELSQSIHGGLGHDYIWAGAGDDLIDGGAGRDFLIGDLGADSFVLSQPARKIYKPYNDTDDLPDIPGVDLITDFNPSQGDKLVIASGLISQSQILDQDLHLFPGISKRSYKKASRAGSVLLFDNVNGYLILNQNLAGKGVGSGGYLAQLEGVASLSPSDIVVI